MDDDGQLFEPPAPEPRKRPGRPRRRHLHTVERDDQLNLAHHADDAVPDNDGLHARPVKAHSAHKAHMVFRDLDTVTRAMRRQWFDLHYLELQAGPGMLLDEKTGSYVPGSPLQALSLPQPFDSYTFADGSQRCVKALTQRVVGHPNVRVLCGDVNDPAHLARVVAPIPRRDLVIAYLDPEGLELHFETVRFLASQFRAIDFLINLPVPGIHRALRAGYVDHVARTLDHPDPEALLNNDEARVTQAIRNWHAGRMRELGFEHITRRVVCVEANNSPLYDVVLASRHPRAVELFNKANRIDLGGQMGLSF
jgi:three-Cys-motif partner protein